MSTRSEIVRVARSYLGTKFHHRGRLPGVGLDCAGVLICTSRELHLVAPEFDLPAYTSSPDGHSMLEWCDQYMTRISQAVMQPGDAIVLITDVYPQHLGIIGDYRHGGLSIIHAANTSFTTGWVVETRLMFSQAQRFVAAYALPGVS